MENIDEATAVLGFWFDEVSPNERFTKDQALDRIIAVRFGVLRETVLASDAEGWRDTPNRLLAAIILLDQFSRNLYRLSSEAFEADPLARSLALEALERGWEDRYTAEQLQFLYLPLMHAEDAEMQALSIAKYETLGNSEALAAARAHRDLILRYGRFPSRNAALTRAATPAEELYLNDLEAGW